MLGNFIRKITYAFILYCHRYDMKTYDDFFIFFCLYRLNKYIQFGVLPLLK